MFLLILSLVTTSPASSNLLKFFSQVVWPYARSFVSLHSRKVVPPLKRFLCSQVLLSGDSLDVAMEHVVMVERSILTL